MLTVLGGLFLVELGGREPSGFDRAHTLLCRRQRAGLEQRFRAASMRKALKGSESERPPVDHRMSHCLFSDMLGPMSLLILGYLSGVVSLFGYPPYLRDIFHGTTKPQRASWLIWTVLGSIAFFSQLAEGATHSLWLTGTQSAGTFIIFLASLWRGEGGLAKRDIISLGVAALGLILWYFTRHAAFALLLVILVDAAGVVPTVLKSWEDPSSETMIAWVLASLGGLLGALAVGSLSFILLIYPLYIVIANLAVVLAILVGRDRLIRKAA